MDQEQTPPAPSVAVSEKIESSEMSGTTPALTQQVVTAKFNRELTLLKFQTSLQSFIDWKVTEDNVPESQKKTKEARGLVTTLGKIKAKLKKPALDECDMWEAAFKSFLKPLEDALTIKDKELQVISKKIAADNLKKEQEKERVDGIKKEIDDFKLERSKEIAAATTTAELIRIEKLIGSHKGNVSRYQEFLPDFVAGCNELTPLIKNQKKAIQELEELEKQKKDAETKGDDRTLLDIQEKQEVIQNSIDETKIVVQEVAIFQATRPDAVTTPEPVMTKLTPRRRSWDFEIVDEKKAFLAGMLVTELNKEKVKAKLNEIKDTMPGDSMIVDGIKYFYKIVY